MANENNGEPDSSFSLGRNARGKPTVWTPDGRAVGLDKRVNHAHAIFFIDHTFKGVGNEDHLIAISAGNVGHQAIH